MYMYTHADSGSLITLLSGDYDSHQDQLSYVIQLVRLGCEYRDDSCEMMDLPSSIPNQKDGEYVYIFTPPEDKSRHTPSLAETSAELSSGSTHRSSQKSHRGSEKNRSARSSQKSSLRRSRSPQPDDNVADRIFPNTRPTSPYLLTYSSNRDHSTEVSLDTFPSETPLEELSHSPARKIWGLFTWHKKKQRSFDGVSTLPPSLRGDEHREQLQIQRSYTHDLGDASYDEHRPVRSTRPVSFGGGGDSFAMTASTDTGGPNVVTVEVEVHDVDASLEMNAESPAHVPKSSGHQSSDGEFLSLPEAALQSTHGNRRRIMSFGSAREVIQRKQRRGKSHSDIHDSQKVPLLKDKGESGYCNESDDSDSSSVRTSSFIEENTPSVDVMSDEIVSMLEQNFKKDHLLREVSTELKVAVIDTVKQGQVNSVSRRNKMYASALIMVVVCIKVCSLLLFFLPIWSICLDIATYNMISRCTCAGTGMAFP